MPQLMILTPRIEVAKFMPSTCCFDASYFSAFTCRRRPSSGIMETLSRLRITGRCINSSQIKTDRNNVHQLCSVTVQSVVSQSLASHIKSLRALGKTRPW